MDIEWESAHKADSGEENSPTTSAVDRTCNLPIMSLELWHWATSCPWSCSYGKYYTPGQVRTGYLHKGHNQHIVCVTKPTVGPLYSVVVGQHSFHAIECTCNNKVWISFLLLCSLRQILIPLLCPDQSTVAQQAEMTVTKCSLTSCMWRFLIGSHTKPGQRHRQPFRLHWVKGVCMFRCNLPPALLAEWPGSFTCDCSNRGWNGQQVRVCTESSLWRREFSHHSCQNSSSQPFDQESGTLPTSYITT